jgi:hypothetical protein
VPGEARERADVALRAFLSCVFADRSEFGFDPVRFEKAYAELERALYEGRCVATVIAPMLGVALEHSTSELALGDGLSLMRGDAMPDVPAEAVWGSDPDGAAAVRARRLRARTDRVDAHRHRRVAAGGARWQRPAEVRDVHQRRARGRVARVLQPDQPPRADQRRGGVGAGAV